MWEFLFPALMFHYFILSVNKTQSYQKWIKLLYFPFILSSIVYFIFTFSFSFDLYSFFVAEDSRFIETYYYLEYNLSFFFGVALLFWSQILIRKSDIIHSERRRWLILLNYSILMLYALWLLADNLEAIIEENIWDVVWGGIAMLFLGVIYFGVYQLRLLERKDEVHRILKNQWRFSSDAANDDKENKYELELLRIMNEEQLYRDSLLNRDILAERMGISSGYLTQIIKEISGMGFVDYINTFRVDAAKKMLSSKMFDKYSIHAIGIEAGFKSRSTFYSTFQKLTGETPGEFKKQKKLS